MTPTLKAKLAELRELEAKATPRPWDYRCNDFIDNHAKPRHLWSEYGFIGHFYSPCGTAHVDAEFTVKSRNALPNLLSALELAVGALEKYKTMSCSTNHELAAKEALSEIERLICGDGK